MIRLYFIVIFCFGFAFCKAQQLKLVKEPAILIYADKNNTLKVDTLAKVVRDTVKNIIIEYRISTGETIKYGARFVWIYHLKNNMPPFPLPN